MEMPHRKLLLGQPQRGLHKHHCRICEKSFSRRKELRDHMRTNVVKGERIPRQGKDPTTAGEECDSAGEVMYAVRTNPNRHRTGRFCENCGKEFVTWRSRLEHGRCSSVEAAAGVEDDAPSPSSPSTSQSRYENKRARHDWKPNSNTLPPPVRLLTEEEDIAHCLVMLSAHEQVLFIANRDQDSSPSTSKKVDVRILRRRARPLQPPVSIPTPSTVVQLPRAMFECRACKKVFNSHQALGGHRASHKKVKGCFAARDEIASPEADNAPVEDLNNNIEDARITVSAENRASSIVPLAEDSPNTLPHTKSKMHQCSICSRQFMSGQALGGHKRCHWLTSKSAAAAAAVAANAEPMTAAAIAEPMTAVGVGSGSNEVNEIEPHTPTIWPMFSSSDSPAQPNMPTPMNEAAEIPPMVDVSTEISLRLGCDTEEKRTNDKATDLSNNVNEKRKASTECLDDEAESKEVKMPRLSDIIEMDEGEESSTWLQVGIGSMADQRSQADRP